MERKKITEDIYTTARLKHSNTQPSHINTPEFALKLRRRVRNYHLKEISFYLHTMWHTRRSVFFFFLYTT